MQVMPASYKPMSLVVAPAGGFITLGLMILVVNAVVKMIGKRKAKEGMA